MSVPSIVNVATPVFAAGSATSTASTATAVSANNTLVVIIRLGIAQFPLSVTDTAGNIFSQIGGVATASSGISYWVARGTIANASNVVTATSNAATNRSIQVIQVAGLVSYPVDTTAVSALTTGTTPTTAPFSTAVANEILFVAGDHAVSGNVWSAAAGWTLQSQDSAGFCGIATKIVSTLQVNVTATLDSNDSTFGKRVAALTLMADATPVVPYAPNVAVITDADSNQGLFGSAWNPTTGALLANRLPLGAFAGRGSGEGGAQLSNGTFAVGGKGTAADTLQSVQIYDTNLNQIGLAYPLPFQGGVFSPMASDWAGRFWLSNIFTGQLVSIAPNGTVGMTVYTLTFGPQALGVLQDNSVAIYAGQNPGDPIRRWDLTGNTDLGVFITPAANTNWGQDLLVVPGTATFVIIAWTNNTENTWTLRQYSTLDGHLIQTIPLPDNQDQESGPRLSLDPGNPSRSIGLRSYTDGTGTTTQLVHIDLQTGQILSTTTIPMDDTNTNPNAAPLSCPFFAWWPSLGPVEVFIGRQVTLPLVRKRRVPMPLLSGMRYQFTHEILAQIERGQGVLDDPTTPARLQMKFSVDNGETWGTERSLSLGRTGAYEGRVYANRWPRARYPVVEITVSDNTNAVLTDIETLTDEADR